LEKSFVPITRFLVTAAAAAAAAASLAGPAQAAPPAPTVDFVALGDSYASGVGAGTESTDCRRTDGAYAPLWAAIDPDAVELTFAACSGATSQDVLTKQLDGLNGDTDLVSVTAGANDLALTDTLRLCVDPRQQAACAAALETIRTRLTTELPRDVGTLLAAVKQKAPKAKVAVVGYPIPFEGVTACPALPISKELRDTGSATFTALNGVLAAAARLTGATFVDAAGAFAGHGLCGDTPWLVGQEGFGNATILHPTARGQKEGYLPAFTEGAGTVEEIQAWITKRDEVPATPTTPAGGGDDDPADGTGGSGGGGTLPLTGVNVWVLIGAGVVLVAAGGGAVVAARRRRVRTVA
jgi:LPXTG-motif cell wall-anchored protein